MSIHDIESFPPITCEDPESFAGFTLRHRLPGIVQSVIDHNPLPREVVLRLSGLIDDMRNGVIRPLELKDASYHLYWQSAIQSQIGRPWSQTPFYFAEAYLYRRIDEIVNGSRNGQEIRTDPFNTVKRQDLDRNRDLVSQMASQTQSGLKNDRHASIRSRMLELMLWGNRSDLSQVQWSPGQRAAMGKSMSKKALLVDDTKLAECCWHDPMERIDIISDNAGVELFTDLLYALAALRTGATRRVVLHVKEYPTFVSDATKADVTTLLNWIRDAKDHPSLSLVSRQLTGYMESQAVEINSHEFWNAPLHFYEMPKELHQSLARSHCILVKGDANYRRLLGDRQVPPESDIRRLTDYFPAVGVAIRVLKSEIVAGLADRTARDTGRRDPDWMVNGRYGMIQMIGRDPKRTG